MPAAVTESTQEQPGILYRGRKPKNCFEREAALVHANQPDPLPQKYDAIRQQPSRRSQQKQARREAEIEAKLTERWQRWCVKVGRRYKDAFDRAEILAVLLGRMAWEIRLCGWDHTAIGADGKSVMQWWASRCVTDRYSIIVMGKDRCRGMKRRRMRDLLAMVNGE